MAEYVKKPVMLDQTGQAIDQDLQVVGTNINSVATSGELINTTLNERGSEIVQKLEDLKNDKFVMDVVKRSNPSVSLVTSKVAVVPTNASELDDYLLNIYNPLKDVTQHANQIEISLNLAKTELVDTTARLNAIKIVHGSEVTALAGNQHNINTLLTGADFSTLLRDIDIRENVTVKDLQNQLTGTGGVNEKIATNKADITNLRDVQLPLLRVSIAETVQTASEAKSIAEQAKDDAAAATLAVGVLETKLDGKQNEIEVDHGLSIAALPGVAKSKLSLNIGDGLFFNSNDQVQVQGITTYKNKTITLDRELPQVSNPNTALQFVIAHRSLDDPLKRQAGYIYIYTE